MAVDFEVKFSGVPAIQCELYDTELAERYLTLLKTQYNKDPSPIFRDPHKYTLSYFTQLVQQAKEQLGWNWHREIYDIPTTTLLHKDIEKYLAQGYENIPEEHDYILNELHFCLHAIESGSKRNNWLQIEWFDDSGFDIDENQYPAKLFLEFGDLRLQNPYVGHHPLFLYEQQDSSNVNQTCRFHDYVKPGINIVTVIHPPTKKEFNWNSYLSWFEKHASDFVKSKGMKTLKKFTGHPVIGSVKNKNDLETLIQQPVIEFKSISFT